MDKESILWAVLAIPIKCKWLLGFTAFPLLCFCHAGQAEGGMEIITRASRTNPHPVPVTTPPLLLRPVQDGVRMECGWSWL